MSSLPTNAELLGYPSDTRLLIVNADDFGMCHSINMATIEAMRCGIVTTTSLMSCCPWAWEAMELLKADTTLSFGIHLTLINEMPGYRWGPVASKDAVSSLVNSDGFFVAHTDIPELYARAVLSEVEREFRAQIERVLNFGLHPTHLDWHCVLDGGRPDILELTLQLCEEFGLAMRVNSEMLRDRLLAMGKPANDFPIVDSYSLPVEGKFARWSQLLHELPVGLNQWAVHVSTGDAEAQAMEPAGRWEVRKTDFEFFLSIEARGMIEQENIVLLDYRSLRDCWTLTL